MVNLFGPGAFPHRFTGRLTQRYNDNVVLMRYWIIVEGAGIAVSEGIAYSSTDPAHLINYSGGTDVRLP